MEGYAEEAAIKLKELFEGERARLSEWAAEITAKLDAVKLDAVKLDAAPKVAATKPGNWPAWRRRLTPEPKPKARPVQHKAVVRPTPNEEITKLEANALDA
jgi:hypothetical protein